MGTENHFISVIIPVYNDRDNLETCLEALKAQTLGKSKFEIIVVDNGSTEDLNKTKANYPEAVFLYEREPGSYSARNKGIENAKGDILAFTDADCIVSENWLARALSIFSSDESIGILAGEVTYFVSDRKNMSAVEVWEMVHKYHQENYVQNYNYGLTANLFITKAVMDEVGLFVPELKSAGDYEWGNRAHKKGVKIHYDRELVIRHPAKGTITQLINKTRRLIGGKYVLGMITKKESIKKILIDILPPVLSVHRLMKSKDLDSLGRPDYKIKYIYVFLLLRYVTVFELARLVLGGAPKR